MTLQEKVERLERVVLALLGVVETTDKIRDVAKNYLDGYLEFDSFFGEDDEI